MTAGFITWSGDPAIFSLGFFSLRWYSLMFMIGFLVSYQMVERFYKNEGKNIEDLPNLLLYMMVATIVGARLGHVLFYDPAYYFSHPLEIVMVWKGGLASHGGFLGVILALYLYQKRQRETPFLWLADRLSVPALFIASLIRVGNFFNSEILGRPSDLPWAVVFARIDSIPRHPAMLYESLSYLMIFVVLFLVYKKTSFREVPGKLLGLAFVLSFTMRFLLEFVKENQESFEGFLPINMGQILSIPFILLGLWLIFRKRGKAGVSGS